MAEQVDQYQKTTKTGKVVTVAGYNRNDGITEQVSADPTRPPLAGKPGTFPTGRFIPGVWVNPSVHSIDDPLIHSATKSPDDVIKEAVNADHHQSEIKQKYGVSAKTSEVIHRALQQKKAAKDDKGKPYIPYKHKKT